MKAIPALILTALLLAGCTGTGRLYDLQTGRVHPFTYSWGGRGRGTMSTQFPNESLSGEYSIISNADIGWGSIYASAYSPAGSATGSGTVTSVSMRGQRRGAAILTGNKGTVIDCEVLVGTNGHGTGGCRDNHGKRYRMMF